MASDEKNASGSVDRKPVVIKKYANRRLYNTHSSSYIALDDLSRMTCQGIDFEVIDAKSGNDITRSVLTQIIMEKESSEEPLLPLCFLRRLIAMYGDSLCALMPHYLAAAMDNFEANQRKLQETWTAGMGPETFARLAEANMKKFLGEDMQRGAPGMTGGKLHSSGEADAPPLSAEQPSEPAPDMPEIQALKVQMDAMQKKLDELAR